MSRLQRVLRLFAVLGPLLSISPHLAYAADPNLAIIANRLKEFSQKIDSLGSFEELGEQIPLTSQTLTEGLKLADLFKDSLKSKLDTITQYADTTELANAIDQADTTVGGPGGVLITFSNVTVSETAFPGFIDVVFTVNATRTINVPLSLSKDAVNLDGGQISIDLALSTTLNFRLDKNLVATDPTLAFFIVGEPTINIDANANGTITGFTTNLGFTQISVGGSAALDLDVDITFQDPDGLLYNGQKRITNDEITATALADLFNVGFVDDPATNAVDASITLDTCLINGCAAPPNTPPDVTYAIVDPSLVDGFQIPPPNLGNLGDFTNIEPAEVLSRLAQLATALLSAQGITDPKLPFLQDTLGDTFAFAQPLVQFVKMQGDAAILCGTKDTDPPTGDVSNLPANTPIYCQAIALKNPTVVAWHIGNGTAGARTDSTSTDPAKSTGALTTVGTNPTANAVFTITGGGSPQVQVQFGEVFCGTTDTDPPTGNVLNLPAGTTVYCQAIVPQTPTLVRWKITNGTAGANTDSSVDPATLNTVGPNPTGRAAFTLSVAGSPQVQVQYSDGASTFSGETHNVIPRFRTAQELFDALVTLVHFDGSPANLRYESATRSLTYHLIKTFDPAPSGGQLGFGSQLQATTNLAGLSPASQASVTIDPSNVKLDLTFGIVLAPGIATDDRFYIQASPTAPELTADVTVNATVSLAGRIGFVDVTAAGNAAENTANPSKAFEIALADATKPMLALNFATGPLTVGSGPTAVTIEDAVGISDLIDNLESKVTAACNVKMSGGLRITAGPLTQPLATGGVAISWPDVFGTDCVPDTAGLGVTPTGDFSGKLKVLDINPSIFGTHNGAANAATLTDTTKNFASVADAVGRTLRNKTDGSSCTVTAAGSNTLSCALAGGTENDWDPGDQYELVGNPQALLSVLLDNLDKLASAIDAFTDDSSATKLLTTKLPIVGKSPKDLLTQLRDLKVKIDEIRTGTPVARCGTTDADPPTGDISSVLANTTIYCQAISSKPVTAATWTMTGGTPGANTSGDPAKNTVAPDPSDNAEFIVNVSGGISNFKVKLQYTDALGDHTAEVPAIAPTSLQNWEQIIESKLGLTSTALTFAMQDLPIPGQTTGDGIQDLIVRLSYGLCTGPASNTLIGSCTPSDKIVPRQTVPLYLDLGTKGIVEVQSAGSLDLEYLARAQLDIAIPLAASFDATSVRVADTSGVTVKAGALAPPNLDLQASVGPLTLKLGTSAVPNMSGQHDGANDAATLTDADGGFVDKGVPVGATLNNTTDGSSCTISAVTNTTLECTLAGGTDNDWDTGDNYQVPLTGAVVAKVGASFRLKLGDDAIPNETFPIAGFTGNLSTSLDGLSNTDCGQVDQDGPGGNPPLTLSGAACAKLSLGLQTGSTLTYLGDVGFVVDFGNAPQISIPPNLDQKIASALLDWTLLIKALQQALGGLAQKLDGVASETSLPLIGDSLDAGANVVTTIKTTLVDPLVPLLDDLKTQTQAGPLRTAIQGKIFSVIGSSLLQDGDDANTTVEQADITVSLLCPPTSGSGPLAECADDRDAVAVADARVTMTIGQGAAPTSTAGCTDPGCASKTIPFDLGLPGLPLRATGSVQVGVGWRLLLDFGLSRDDGPYIVADHGLNNAELKVGATAQLGNAPEACAGDDVSFPAPDNTDPNVQGLKGYKTTRCLAGELGFLRVTIHDGDDDDGTATPGNPNDDRTNLSMLGTLDLTSNTSDGRLTFPQLLSGAAGLTFALNANANVNLRFRTGLRLDEGESAGFPSVLGTFHLAWNWNSQAPGATSPTTLRFDDLNLDAGQFVSQYLGPIVRDVKRVTSPLQPVIETVQAPIPVLSELAALTGQPPVTLLGLMQAISGNDLSMLDSIIAFVNFVNNLPADQALLIPLGSSPGSFDVPPSLAKSGPLTPDQAGALITNPDSTTGLLSQLGGAPPPGRTGAFGVPGLSFPIFENSLKIFGVLMGQDQTLVRYEAGNLSATASINYDFPPIFVGPIPIGIGVFGSVTLKGRFAVGYDTTGLRQVIQGANASRLLNGLFLDDLDAKGVDVAEISLIGTVGVRAGVEAVAVSAGVEGGIQLTVDLNLHDGPELDGKLRIQEIFDRLSNPICLFDVSGKLDAFLGAYVRIGFSFFSKTFRVTIAKITLLDFSASCPPSPPPNLADPDQGTQTLYLNMGPRSGNRDFAESEKNEQFTVRQLEARPRDNSDGKGAFIFTFAITAFGIYEEEQLFANSADQITIWARGADGDDVIALEPSGGPDIIRCGTSNTDPPTGDIAAVAAGATIYCQAQNDKPVTSATWSITGGTAGTNTSGAAALNTVGTDPTANAVFTVSTPGTFKVSLQLADASKQRSATVLADGKPEPIQFRARADIDGGDNNDQIKSGDAADTLRGGAGTDKINGGDGNDAIYGDGEDDILSGELGTDTIYGGAGNDAIAGGPGRDILYGQGGGDEIQGGPGTTASPDLNDDIYGGDGNDNIEGNDGQDNLYGDDSLSCDQDGDTGDGNDQIVGGKDRDYIRGGGGNDTLLGEEGDDDICGNGGSDRLDGDDDDNNPANDGNDTLRGGSNNDELHGQSGDDDMFGQGGNDTLVGEAGNDDMSGGSGMDTLDGGAGRDYLFGDDGSAVRPVGQADATSVSFSESSGENDTLQGGSENDVMYGEGGVDDMQGDAGADTMYGNDGGDTMRGGQQDDTMYGNADADVMFGDSGADDMFGGTGNDTMRGNSDDDYMEGNQDVDTMYGDGGQDDMIGGSSTAGTPDARDLMYGSASFDVMAGDNAQITRPGGTNTFDGSVKRDVTLLDIDSSDATLSGADEMYGNEANDRMYGQGSGDTMSGGSGDDFMQGNAGDDYMYGNEGQDDIIGGSSAAGRLDGADHIWGGSNGPDLPNDFDVIMGDNAAIARPLDGAGQWKTNTFNGGIVRTTTLFDVAVAGGPAVSAAFSGGDTMFGEGNDDLMYGQGGGDTMSGGSGDDYMEGNAGVDYMFGDAGNDDMVGGTGRINSDGPAGTPGRLDASDEMHGGTGFDVMAGDNALLVRTLSASGAWQQNSFNGGIQHNPRILLDMATATPSFAPPAGTSDGDTMFGDDSDDLMYGQGGGDEMHGGAGDDFMEGNGDRDTMFGDPDQDDMIGGTVAAGFSDSGDEMHGGDSADVMLGDNGTIDRPLSGGQWVRKTFSSDPAVDAANIVDRTVTLLDVQTVGGSTINAATSGGDTMFGDGGRDLMFGQGNGGQPNTAGDPPDGVDNDLDGRESAGSAGYDCRDGSDNDGDGLTDGADPQCAASIDEDAPWQGDTMHGGDGHDYMEGNHGADWMFGDGGEDDMLGGGSSGNGLIPGGTLPTNLRDGNDIMDGGAEDDVMLGDNGRITRPLTAGLWRVLSGFGFNLVVRETSMDTAPLPPAGAFGNDHMRGGADHDDMYGQLGNDYMEGNAGEDAMVGDLGLITNNLLGDGINDPSQLDVFIAPQQPFISDTIFKTGTLYRQVQLYAFTGPGAGVGNDIMLGDDGNDSMHGGPGNDLMNGDGDSLPDGPDADPEPDDPILATVDEDHLFGGDGNDVMWGGRGHDHLWGGYGADYLDVKPRPATPGFPADPPIWFFVGGTDNFQGIDYIYGGWDQDAMQANVGDAGPVIGDRLIDWAGAYNAYYLCPGLYGDYVATRAIAPGLIEFLQQLAAGDGAVETTTSGSSGFRETAIVFPKDVQQNTSPPHPDNPGHFTCTP